MVQHLCVLYEIIKQQAAAQAPSQLQSVNKADELRKLLTQTGSNSCSSSGFHP